MISLNFFKREQQDVIWAIEHFGEGHDVQLIEMLRHLDYNKYNLFTTVGVAKNDKFINDKRLSEYVNMTSDDSRLLKALVACTNPDVFDILVNVIKLENPNELLRIFLGLQKEVPFTMLLNSLRSSMHSYRINYDLLAKEAVTEISNLRFVAIIDTAFAYDVL